MHKDLWTPGPNLWRRSPSAVRLRGRTQSPGAKFSHRFCLAPAAEALRDTLNDDGNADAFPAATAPEVARRHDLPVPPWTIAPGRYLPDPHFALKSRKNWLMLLQDSPAEFRARRIFVSANVLGRV